MAATHPVQRKIAVDAMGGDKGPAEVVAAVKLAFAQEHPVDAILLVGREDTLRPLLAKEGLDNDPRLRIVHASEVIEMEDKPIQALKRKKDASMVRTVELLKTGEANAAISCGNTGALMACGTLRLRPMEGVTKPAIATVIPGNNHFFILIDGGANPMAKAEQLVHNAVLGSWYARIVLKLPNPRVGLLSIGTEEGKGNDLTNETHEYLKRLRDNSVINYSGLIEGLHIFNNHVDVVVCDGFVGNIVLKTCESLVHLFKDSLRTELKRNPIRMLGALLSKGAFADLKKRMSPDAYGGAPMLGLNGMLLKAHGGSNRYALSSAIRIAGDLVEYDLNHEAKADLLKANDLVKAMDAEKTPQPAEIAG